MLGLHQQPRIPIRYMLSPLSPLLELDARSETENWDRGPPVHMGWLHQIMHRLGLGVGVLGFRRPVLVEPPSQTHGCRHASTVPGAGCPASAPPGPRFRLNGVIPLVEATPPQTRRQPHSVLSEEDGGIHHQELAINTNDIIRSFGAAPSSWYAV